MSERKRSVLTRGETMFWESAFTIAVLLGVFAAGSVYQFKPEPNPILVLLLGVAPWTIVWIARKFWKPRRLAPGEGFDVGPYRYSSSDPVSDMMYQADGPHLPYIAAIGSALALVATFVYRGNFEGQDGLEQVSAMLGFFVGTFLVRAQWAMRRPLVNVPDRPRFGFLMLVVVLALGATLYLFRDGFSAEGRVIAGALVGGGLGVSLAMWLRNVRG